jgi:hypothetical protein
MHDETMWPNTYEELGVELFPEVPKGFNPLEATKPSWRSAATPTGLMRTFIPSGMSTGSGSWRWRGLSRDLGRRRSTVRRSDRGSTRHAGDAACLA